MKSKYSHLNPWYYKAFEFLRNTAYFLNFTNYIPEEIIVVPVDYLHHDYLIAERDDYNVYRFSFASEVKETIGFSFFKKEIYTVKVKEVFAKRYAEDEYIFLPQLVQLKNKEISFKDTRLFEEYLLMVEQQNIAKKRELEVNMSKKELLKSKGE